MRIHESCKSQTKHQHVPTQTAYDLYYYVTWTGHFDCNPDFHIRRFNMDSFLLIYTIKGSATLHLREHSFSVPPKSILFLDCNEFHEYYPAQKEWEFKFVHFDGQSSKQYFKYITRLYNSPIITDADTLELYFDTICLSVRAKEDEELCSALLYTLLTKLISKNRQDAEGSDIKTALRYIAENFTKDISVQELADLMHMSRTYFSMQFKKFTGYAPHTYLLSYRLQTAKQLLCDTNDSVETVGSKCGFSDTSSFIRTFRRIEGISPLAYRKSNRG